MQFRLESLKLITGPSQGRRPTDRLVTGSHALKAFPRIASGDFFSIASNNSKNCEWTLFNERFFGLKFTNDQRKFLNLANMKFDASHANLQTS